MVRRKQANPYHGTKENVDSIVNATPLITEIITLPKRPIPPLLRFGILLTRCDNPETARRKLIDDFDYQHEQGDEIQRSIQEMTLGDLRNALQGLGLKVTGKKQHLVNRLIGSQPKGRLTTKGGKDKSGKPSPRPQSPSQSTSGSTTSPSTTPPPTLSKVDGTGESNGGNGVKQDERRSPEANRTPEEKREEEVEEEVEETDKDEVSTSTSPYAGLKVTELRAELRKRGLNMMGRKDELADRLEADDALHGNASKEISPQEVEGKKKGRRTAASDEEDSGQDDDDDDTDEYIGDEDGRGRGKRKIEPKKEKKGPGGHWRKKKRV